MKPSQKPADGLQRNSQIAFGQKLFVESRAESEVLENQDPTIRVKIDNFRAAGVTIDRGGLLKPGSLDQNPAGIGPILRELFQLFPGLFDDPTAAVACSDSANPVDIPVPGRLGGALRLGIYQAACTQVFNGRILREYQNWGILFRVFHVLSFACCREGCNTAGLWGVIAKRIAGLRPFWFWARSIRSRRVWWIRRCLPPRSSPFTMAISPIESAPPELRRLYFCTPHARSRTGSGSGKSFSENGSSKI